MLNKFLSHIDYFKHNISDISINIVICDSKEEYFSLVCNEHKKKNKLTPAVKKIFEKSYGLTFFDDNNAAVFIKKIPGNSLNDKIKSTLIIYHELSHAVNNKRFIDIDENTDDELVTTGKHFIDELLAHYDSMYCIKKEFNVPFEDKIDEFEILLNIIRNDGFNMYPLCTLISYIWLYIDEYDFEKIDNQYIDVLSDVINIACDIEYLITKEYFTDNDCRNIINSCADNLSFI